MPDCHEIDYEIFGDDMQYVEVELDPGESVIAEAGVMTFMEAGIDYSTHLGDGREPDKSFFDKLLGTGVRGLSGDSIFMTHFTNNASQKRRIAFSAPVPGKIVDVNLARAGGEFTCVKDSFLCAAYGTKLSIAMQRRLGSGFFGGDGFVLQRLAGDGFAFVHACGTVIKKTLRGESLRVDTGCLVGFTSGIVCEIERARELRSMLLGDDGMFIATLSGQGSVLLQSLPFARLADRVLQHTSGH
jgi:uncharacterized protein (AIM24 family)